MTASKENVIEDAVYTLDLVDQEADVAKLLINSNFQPVDFYPLSQTFEKFLHVSFDIENIYELANISFDGQLMVNQSMFYDETTGEYIGFDRVIVSPPFNPFDVVDIMDFYGEDAANPHDITAGTGEILTIVGSGFEGDKGTIEFYDADFSGVGTSKVETSVSDIITWTDLQITVRVPSSDADFSGHTAGTGLFKVVLPGAVDFAESDDVLNVKYSVDNFRTTSGVSIPIHLGDGEDGDGDDNGQLVFTLSNSMNDIMESRVIIEEALCKWNAETKINWELASMPSTNTTAADGDMVNLIYVGDESEFMGVNADAAAYTILKLGTNDRRITCNGSGSQFQNEVDIVFREGANLANAGSGITGWHYTDLSTPTDPSLTEIDFYSYILHELGHAHMLRHVRESPKLMSKPFGLGFLDRSFEPEDKAGGRFVLAKTKEVYDLIPCSEDVHTTFVNSMWLCGNGPTAIDDISQQEFPIKYYLSNGQLIFEFPEKGFTGSYTFELYSIDGKHILSNKFEIFEERGKIGINLGMVNLGFFAFTLVNEKTNDHLSGKLVLTQ